MTQRRQGWFVGLTQGKHVNDIRCVVHDTDVNGILHVNKSGMKLSCECLFLWINFG
jgi:hypothetical protein